MLTNSSETDWFISWFDTKYYQLLYRDRDNREAEDFLNNLLHVLKPPTNSAILDLACGRGRHAVFLNSQGYDVTGIDASVNSIAMASEAQNDGLHFAVHDMRVPFAKEKFDYVFNLFTSFGYFADRGDDRRVLDAVFEALKPNGVFVFDFFNASKVAQNLVASEVKVVDGLTFTISREIMDDFVIKTIRFHDQGRAFEFQERVRLITKQQMISSLLETGFDILAEYGDYKFSPFTAETADRLIIIAKKR